MRRTTVVALTIVAVVAVTALSATAQVAPKQQGPILKPRGPIQPKIQIPKLPRVQLPAVQDTIPIEVQLKGRQSLDTLARQMPKEMPILQTKPDLETARRAAEALADRFEMEGEFRADPEDQHIMLHEDAPFVIELNEESGSLFFGDMSRLWTWTPEPGNNMRPMAENEALEKARSILQQVLGEAYPVPIWEPGAPVVSKVSYDVAEVAMADEEGQRTGKTMEMQGPAQVTFRPIYTDTMDHPTPTVGPGGKVKVFFDQENEFAGLLMVRRNVQATGEQPLTPLPDAIRQMEQGAAMAELTLTRPERIIINDISLGYFMRSANFNQSFAPPVYVFEGTAFGRQGEDRWKVPYHQWLPAVQKLPEPLTPAGEEFKPRPHTEIESPVDEDE